jgi:outer membrane protein OmpA-like peptidoglycan-associated protein
MRSVVSGRHGSPKKKSGSKRPPEIPSLLAHFDSPVLVEEYMPKRSVAGLGLVLWGAMLFYCIPRDGRHIEHDLAAKSATLLSRHNISPDGLENVLRVDGRDVTLTGYEGTPEVSDGTVKMVEAIWGVRRVHINILHRPGAPKPVVTRRQAREAAASIAGILKLEDVEFYSGSERLTPLGQRTLNQVAGVLAKYPGMPVEIAGHTDSQGDPATNMELSRKRAASVKQYLVEKGIAGENLTDEGFGSTKPIASNATAAGRQENRRVEFHTKETN